MTQRNKDYKPYLRPSTQRASYLLQLSSVPKLRSSNLIAIVCAFLLGNTAWAVKGKSLYLGMSVLSHDLMNVSQQSSASPSFLGPLFFPFAIQTHFFLDNSWAIGPRLNYTFLLTHNAVDGGSKSSYAILTLPVEKMLTDLAFDGEGFNWSAGPAYLLYTIQGSGGTVVQGNGNGTATYALPGSTVNASTLALDLGFGYSTSDFDFQFDTLTEGFLNPSNRLTFSLMLTVTYNVLKGSNL